MGQTVRNNKTIKKAIKKNTLNKEKTEIYFRLVCEPFLFFLPV